MKIALAQLAPVKGDLESNGNRHLAFAEKAARAGADALFFPELSLTGYEPALADSLALRATDVFLDRFQNYSDQSGLLLGVGLPLRVVGGVQIGLIVFRPGMARVAYAKQILHPDELPWFLPGTETVFIQWAGETIAPAICYESLQDEHAQQAAAANATVYLASVAKTAAGVAKAEAHYPVIARRNVMHVLMTNSVGPNDDFIAAGRSGAWNKEGALVQQLPDEEEGLLIYDTGNEMTSVIRL
jgi:predicted amidohydrolase